MKVAKLADNSSSQTDVSLDDKYDTVTEAKSILDSWLQKKTEIDEHGFLFEDEFSSEVSLSI